MHQQYSSWSESGCNLHELMQNPSTSMNMDRLANGSGNSGLGITATHVSNNSLEEQFFTGSFDWNQPANQSYYSPEQSITLENNYFLAPYSPSEDELNDIVTAEDVNKIINQLSAHSPKIKVEPSTITETESPGSFVPFEEISSTLAYPKSLAVGGPQLGRGQPGQVVKTKSARKSSLSQRAVAESPINEMIYSNSYGHEVVPAPGKQKMSAVSESTKKNLKRRVLSSTSAANVPPKVVSKSELIDQDQELLQMSTIDAATKKPKMHQNVDDPRCRNAYLAHINRERKREEEKALRSENEKFKTENETLKRDNELLTNELLQHRRLNKSFVGLQRLFPSVSNMMETIMKSLDGNNGGWKLVTPPWFDQVPSSSHIDLDENHTSLSASIDDTSNYITLHMNPTDRIVQMDYTPLTPNVMMKETPDAV